MKEDRISAIGATYEEYEKLKRSKKKWAIEVFKLIESMSIEELREILLFIPYRNSQKEIANTLGVSSVRVHKLKDTQFELWRILRCIDMQEKDHAKNIYIKLEEVYCNEVYIEKIKRELDELRGGLFKKNLMRVLSFVEQSELNKIVCLRYIQRENDEIEKLFSISQGALRGLSKKHGLYFNIWKLIKYKRE